MKTEYKRNLQQVANINHVLYNRFTLKFCGLLIIIFANFGGTIINCTQISIA